jgi:predicted Ser/Thr protein kinase
MAKKQQPPPAQNINQPKEDTVCTKCGAHFYAEAKFCAFDGAELLPCAAENGTGTARSSPVAMQCSVCNTKYPGHAKFCGVDGVRLVPWKSTVRIGGERPAQPLAGQQSPLAPGGGSLKAIAAQVARGNPAADPSPERPPEPETDDDADARWSPPEAQELVGKTLEEKYRIDSVFAEGGMAILYLAHHTTMERTVVVKVVHGDLISSPSAIKRFEREAKLMARLNHPNIVTVYDFGFINSKQPFLVMEYIRGRNLSERVANQGPPNVKVAAQIIKQICRGLEEAHTCGVIHRDLKPDNIIIQDKVERPDWVKIVDFGIAHLLDGTKRLTRSGRVTGTPEYMAPEQFKGKQLDVRVDVYSLGVVMFEVLTGRLPFESNDISVLMAKHLMETAPLISAFRKDIGEGSPVDILVQKCLEKEPADRFESIKELRRAVESAFV